MESSKVISLKLLIDAESKKLLFAEAGKDFVDFSCYLLVLPVGTIMDLLQEEPMVWCLSNLYESIQNLSDTYMLSGRQTKESLLTPASPLTTKYSRTLLCGARFNMSGNVLGFVEEETSYMVMDDLSMQPISTGSIITLLKNRNIKGVGCLEEKVVNFGTTELALKLLKASFCSKTVLTDVFLKNG